MKQERETVLEIKAEIRGDFRFLVWKLFRKELKASGEPELLEAIFGLLIEHPVRGDILSGGIRKARVGSKRKNKGKSGGYRFLYYLQTERTIHLISLLDKSDADNFDKRVLKGLQGVLKSMELGGKP